MRALGVALFSLAVLDLLIGSERRRVTTAVAVAAATASAVAGGLAVGLSPRGTAFLALTVLAESPLWIAARGARGRAAAGILGALLGVLALRMATVGIWYFDGRRLFDEWADTLPGLLGSEPERVAYVGGVVAFLLTAGNTYVRLLLGASPGLAPTDPKAPGGGRVIGSIERVLIFALAVAGDVAAAAVVISAKGILRFAEVRATPNEDVDRVTEYVLVGSLASLTLALAFVPFAVA